MRLCVLPLPLSLSPLSLFLSCIRIYIHTHTQHIHTHICFNLLLSALFCDLLIEHTLHHRHPTTSRAQICYFLKPSKLYAYGCYTVAVLCCLRTLVTYITIVIDETQLVHKNDSPFPLSLDTHIGRNHCQRIFRFNRLSLCFSGVI